jgi:hypothetical protein
MMVFGMWLLAGVALGMILMAFLSIGTYQRGYDAGFLLRKPWRAELLARRQGVMNAFAREKKAAARTRVTAGSSPGVAPSHGATASPAAASGG